MIVEMTNHQNFYGRFKGRPLGSQKNQLMDEFLNNVRVQIEPEHQYHPRDFFQDSHQVLTSFELEIGFGGGEHLAYRAQINPTIGFIGCEVFINGVASLLRQIKDQQLNNIRVYDAVIQNLIPALKDQCLAGIHIMFPDPWPKFRHKKRQLVNMSFLNQLSRILTDDGCIHLASDDEDYVHTMIEAIDTSSNLQLIGHTNRLVTERPFTKYEQKAIEQNRQCHYLTVVKTNQDGDR